MKNKITGVAVAGLFVATLLFAIICVWPKNKNEEKLRDIKQYADGFGGTYDGRTI